MKENQIRKQYNHTQVRQWYYCISYANNPLKTLFQEIILTLQPPRHFLSGTEACADFLALLSAETFI
jgi:hypothetical protein